MTILQRLWDGFKRVMCVVGDFQARLILTVLYIIMIAPMGLIVRAVSDPLRIRRPADASVDSYWIPRVEENDPKETPLDEARRQF